MKNKSAQSLGKLGGQATAKKLGTKHFSRAGKLGMAKRWAKPNPPTETVCGGCNKNKAVTFDHLCLDCVELFVKPKSYFDKEPTVEKWEIDFGDTVTIEQKRFGVPNEHFGYKVIGRLKSNSYVDVPVQSPAKETIHKESVDVVRCVCIGVSETEVLKYRLSDVKLVHSSVQEAKAERDKFWINRINIMLDGVQDAYGEWYKDRLTKLSTLNTKGGK